MVGSEWTIATRVSPSVSEQEALKPGTSLAGSVGNTVQRICPAVVGRHWEGIGQAGVNQEDIRQARRQNCRQRVRAAVRLEDGHARVLADAAINVLKDVLLPSSAGTRSRSPPRLHGAESPTRRRSGTRSMIGRHTAPHLAATHPCVLLRFLSSCGRWTGGIFCGRARLRPSRRSLWGFSGEGEAPSEPIFLMEDRLGRSLALPKRLALTGPYERRKSGVYVPWHPNPRVERNLKRLAESSAAQPLGRAVRLLEAQQEMVAAADPLDDRSVRHSDGVVSDRRGAVHLHDVLSARGGQE